MKPSDLPPWPEMRFNFVPNPARPGFVIIHDSQTDQVVAEFCDEHAQMIYCMYATLHQRHPYAGDEFMYGHVMGYTLTLIHADKYPKITVVRGLGGVTIQAQQPDGTKSETKHVDSTVFDNDLLKRVVPPNFGKKHGH